MKIVIIGQGGHSKVIEDIILSYKENQIVGYLDDKYSTFTVFNGLYTGPITAAQQLIHFHKDIKFIIAIGNNAIRKSVTEKLDLPDEYYATLVHKTAVISSSVIIHIGTVIMANAVINAGSKIGQHTIINTASVIEHDNSIGAFVHISPNATLTGGVRVEEGVHIGAGATIIPNTLVEEWSVIGAGATVINTVLPHTTSVGVPAKVRIKEGDKFVKYLHK